MSHQTQASTQTLAAIEPQTSEVSPLLWVVAQTMDNHMATDINMDPSCGPVTMSDMALGSNMTPRYQRGFRRQNRLLM